MICIQVMRLHHVDYVQYLIIANPLTLAVCAIKVQRMCEMVRLILVVCVTNLGLHLNMIDAGVHSRMSVGRCAEAISCRTVDH